jgi:hypothetical protein
MDKNSRAEFATEFGTKNTPKTIGQILFEMYVYLVLTWVICALGFDIYMIIKHFQE